MATGMGEANGLGYKGSKSSFLFLNYYNYLIVMLLSYFSFINVIFICLCIAIDRKPKFNKEESGEAESE